MQASLAKLVEEANDPSGQISHMPVVPQVNASVIRDHLDDRYSFHAPIPLEEIMDDVTGLMREWHLHSVHPRYFGLFNPTANLASLVADALVALYNPQLAVWSHAPAANEIEQFTLRYVMGCLGLDPATSQANSTTGGAEANLSAVQVALTHQFPTYGDVGLIQALGAQPLIYLSEEAHDSFTKIAHTTGLGRQALRTIPVDNRLRMDVDRLARRFDEDKAAGHTPFLVVGTEGTTSAGVIDPLPELAAFCRERGLWFHVDAAWGGAAALSPRLCGYLRGIELADSITCDAHKGVRCRWVLACSSAGTGGPSPRPSASALPTCQMMWTIPSNPITPRSSGPAASLA